MLVCTRGTHRTRRSSVGRRSRAGTAVVATFALALAACADDTETAGEQVEAPVDGGAVDAPAGDDTDADEAPAAPGFETLQGGEVVPGVRLEAPVNEATEQAHPTPVGSAYVAALGETGAVTVNVEFDGQSVDELVSGIDDLVESGQAELTSEAEPIEVEGTDEAVAIELIAPGGEASATGVFANADGNAISIAVEVLAGSDVDVDAIIRSIVIDPERLQAEGVLQLDDVAPPPDASTQEEVPSGEPSDPAG